MSWVVVEEEGRRLRLAVVPTAKGVWVGWRGGATLVRPVQAFASAADSDDAVVAPMTGKVVRVEVAPGHRVHVDDLLVVLEAMKMEYRLTAPHAGLVEAVHCAEGDLVDLGAILVTLGAAES